MLPSYVGIVINSIIRMPIKQSGVYGMQEIFVSWLILSYPYGH